MYLRHGGQDIINLSTATKVDVEELEWFQYFGNFMIVRRANNAYINKLNRLGLSFDGTNVKVITRTRQRTDGPGALYFNEDAGVAFYTTSFVLIQRISDALNIPGGLPTPPPDEGKLMANTLIVFEACFTQSALDIVNILIIIFSRA